MKILMEPYLDLKAFATSVLWLIPSVVSSGESWFKLLLTTGTWECHRTCWTLSPPIPQFMVLSDAGKGIVVIMITDNEI